MQLADTHCHIHSADYSVPIADVDAHCVENNVAYLICVGTDAADSERAVQFVAGRANCWASIGQHPHEAKFGMEPLKKLRALLEVGRAQNLVLSGAQTSRQPGVASDGAAPTFLDVPIQKRRGGLDDEARGTANTTINSPEPSVASLVPARQPSQVLAKLKRQGTLPSGATRHLSWSDSTKGVAQRIVAIGECGLDYFYGHSSKSDQEKALRYQIELALEYNLPLIFHVRDAFDDFWPIFDSYQGVRGELHSFTDNQQNLEKALERNLLIGVNGIITFTKNAWQLEVAKQIPLNKILLETDAPFLTPTPNRGKVNEPANVMHTAMFLSELRQESLTQLAEQTTANARHLFSL